MNSREIVDKSIAQALTRGWPKEEGLKWVMALNEIEEQSDFGEHVYAGLIYNHDFAKALWGDKKVKRWSDSGPSWSPMIEYDIAQWQWNLAEMVTAPDPIKYLSENLPE